MNEVSGGSSRGASPRGTLMMLLLLFLGPLVVALVLYFGGYDWRPAGTVEHGVLLSPARPLPPVTLSTPGGESLGGELMDGIWTVVQLNDAPCDEGCRQALVDTRQVRLSLGRRMTRVQRVLVTRGATGNVPVMLAQHPELIVVTGDGLPDEWVSQFNLDGESPFAYDRVYIVDPLGNVVMAYEAGFELKGLQEDLKRLLRLSSIG